MKILVILLLLGVSSMSFASSETQQKLLTGLWELAPNRYMEVTPLHGNRVMVRICKKLSDKKCDAGASGITLSYNEKFDGFYFPRTGGLCPFMISVDERDDQVLFIENDPLRQELKRCEQRVDTFRKTFSY